MRSIFVYLAVLWSAHTQAQYYSTQPDANTPVKFVKVLCHFVRDANGGNNFSDEDAKIAAINYIKASNLLLTKRPIINLTHNSTVVSTLPAKYRYVIAPRANDFNDPDADGIYFHNEAGTENFIESVNVNTLYGHLVGAQQADAINIFFVRGMNGTGIAVLGSNYCTVKVNIADPYDVSCAATLNHEVAHCLGRRHTWGTSINPSNDPLQNCIPELDADNTDECDDTPRNTNCWNVGAYRTNTPCSAVGISLCQTADKISNNMMDYNHNNNALSPCQLGAIHQHLNDNPRFVTTSVSNCDHSASSILRNNASIASDIVNMKLITIRGNSSVSFTSQNTIKLEAVHINLYSGFNATPIVGKTFSAKSIINSFSCQTVALNTNESTWDAYHKDYFGSIDATGLLTGLFRIDGSLTTGIVACGTGIDNTIGNNTERKELVDQALIKEKPASNATKKDCFTIYPNPSSGTINITSTCQDSYGVQIFNSSGSLISNYSAILENKLQLPLVGNGLFTVRLQTENEVIIKKIISYE